MRIAGAVVLLLVVLLNGGCALVVATAMVASSVAVATVSTAGKVTVATVKTTGKVVSSAVTSSGNVASLSMEAAAKLARAGAVVAVDASTGAVTELPWQQGMRLYTAAQTGQIGGTFNTAKIFRSGQTIAADLRKVRAGLEDRPLRPGDVLELRR